jgi:hypothetical protein
MPKNKNLSCDDIIKKLCLKNITNDCGFKFDIQLFKEKIDNTSDNDKCDTIEDPICIENNYTWGNLTVDPVELANKYNMSCFYINIVLCESKCDYWIVKNFRIQTRKEFDMPKAFTKSFCKCSSCIKKFGKNSDIKFRKGVLQEIRQLDKMQTNFSLRIDDEKDFAIKNADVVVFLSEHYIPDYDDDVISILLDRFKYCKFSVNFGEMLICHGGVLNDDEEDCDLKKWLECNCPESIPLGYLGDKLKKIKDPCPIQNIECIKCKSIQQLTNRNIHSAKNQSVSVAHANCIEFLNRLPGSGTNIGGRIHEEGMRPDSKFNKENNILKLEEWDDGTLVGLLDSDNYMDRQEPETMCKREEDGEGIGLEDMVCGLIKFFDENECNFNIDNCIEYAGIYCIPNNITNKSCYNFRKCDLTFDWICEKIDCGYAVYGSYGIYTGDLKARLGGQAFRITGVRICKDKKCKDRKWITTMDDRDQTNDCNGLRIKEWDVSDLVECSESNELDGMMRMDGSDRILTFAIAYKLDKPTYLIGLLGN